MITLAICCKPVCVISNQSIADVCLVISWDRRAYHGYLQPRRHRSGFGQHSPSPLLGGPSLTTMRLLFFATLPFLFLPDHSSFRRPLPVWALQYTSHQHQSATPSSDISLLITLSPRSDLFTSFPPFRTMAEFNVPLYIPTFRPHTSASLTVGAIPIRRVTS